MGFANSPISRYSKLVVSPTYRDYIYYRPLSLIVWSQISAVKGFLADAWLPVILTDDNTVAWSFSWNVKELLMKHAVHALA